MLGDILVRLAIEPNERIAAAFEMNLHQRYRITKSLQCIYFFVRHVSEEHDAETHFRRVPHEAQVSGIVALSCSPRRLNRSERNAFWLTCVAQFSGVVCSVLPLPQMDVELLICAHFLTYSFSLKRPFHVGIALVYATSR